MKRLLFVLLAATLIPISGCSLITPDTPFFGDFIDTTPDDLISAHSDVRWKMKGVQGTRPWEYTVLPSGCIAGHVDDEGFPAWCSNYVVAMEHRLKEIGYRPEQMQRRRCSIFNTDGPDHVVLLLRHPDGNRYVFDSGAAWVQKPEELPTEPYLDQQGYYRFPYIWWELDGKEWKRKYNL